MKITICAIGKVKGSSLEKQSDDYLKRITWPVQIKEFELKKKLSPDMMKSGEADLLLESVPKSAIKIVLDENGKNITSEEFAKKITQWQELGHSNFAFLIGGAHGHGKKVLDSADLVLSLGKMTWPHMLVRVMLAEQIYRAYTIITGHPYHKG